MSTGGILRGFCSLFFWKVPMPRQARQPNTLLSKQKTRKRCPEHFGVAQCKLRRGEKDFRGHFHTKRSDCMDMCYPAFRKSFLYYNSLLISLSIALCVGCGIPFDSRSTSLTVAQGRLCRKHGLQLFYYYSG